MNYWPIPISYFGGYTGPGFVLGLLVWARLAKRRAKRVLSFGQRVTLALLLIGLLFAWWVAIRGNPDDHQGYNKPLSEELADSLNIEVPAATSFERPDLRIVGTRHVLMLLPPVSMEWKLTEMHRTLEISYGFEPTAYEKGTTNGAEVIVELVDQGKTTEIFRRMLDPIPHPADRGLQRSVIHFPAYSPGSRLYLRTTPGPFGDTAWDWVYLASFRFRD